VVPDATSGLLNSLAFFVEFYDTLQCWYLGPKLELFPFSSVLLYIITLLISEDDTEFCAVFNITAFLSLPFYSVKPKLNVAIITPPTEFVPSLGRVHGDPTTPDVIAQVTVSLRSLKT
jgi:hypothetical protein